MHFDAFWSTSNDNLRALFIQASNVHFWPRLTSNLHFRINLTKTKSPIPTRDHKFSERHTVNQECIVMHMWSRGNLRQRLYRTIDHVFIHDKGTDFWKMLSRNEKFRFLLQPNLTSSFSETASKISMFIEVIFFLCNNISNDYAKKLFKI